MSTVHQHPYLPWLRADALLGSSLYWLGVSVFPVRDAEKQWLRHFLLAFDAEMKSAFECRVEVFVHRDAIYPDMMEPLITNVTKLNPIPGVIRFHGESLRKAPPPRKILQMVDEGNLEPLLKIGSDVGWWFARKNAGEQRELFFGLGGMINVWLPPDPKTAPPKFPIPEKARQDPAFAGMDIDGTVQLTYSLVDSFLPNSLTVFAPELKSDPQYQGYPFALTLLKSEDILTARGEQREEWLKLAPCYLFESRHDRGILLWGIPGIDDVMTKVLATMREQELEYPLR